MLDYLQYSLLKRIAPGEPTHMTGAIYANKSKLRILLGDDIFDKLRGTRVIDYGCGDGAEAIEIATAGAELVVGIDIRSNCLDRARKAAADASLSDRCRFMEKSADLLNGSEDRWDAVVSVDAFEHFAKPNQILAEMFQLLRPGGRVYTSFGPTWFHPLGGHMCSVFPWAHLVFNETALMRWRAHLRSDGATKFSEVEGGLNKMTIQRFERLVHESNFEVEQVHCVPIRKLRWVSFRLTREFTTAIVRATLRRPTSGAVAGEK